MDNQADERLAAAERPWHQQQGAAVLEALGSSPAGLGEAQAAQRLAAEGPNQLEERGGTHPLRLLWAQLTSVMVLILLAAALLSLFLGKWLEAGSILAIVLLFALLGFVQEYRAERAIAALKQLAVPQVRVRRAGQVRELSSSELVRGDVVLLEAGSVLPADLRLLESASLQVQEAALTGESEAVSKHQQPLAEGEIALGDRRNMAYMGTLVTYGRGSGVVVATGMRTELGRVATLLQGVKEEATPLQTRLDQVGKQLAVGGVLVALLVMGIGLAAGETVGEMLLTAISVAVAVIPEGLPAVVTFTLALGAQRMLSRNALIRRLPAVETLGSVTVICSDKTGTLTENRMTVTTVESAGQRVLLEEGGAHEPALALLLAGGALCNDAMLEDGAGSATIGDPTEAALLGAAQQGGLHKGQLDQWLPRVAELPFDSVRKRMTTLHTRPEAQALPAALQPWARGGHAPDAPFLAVTKGAVDGLLDQATHEWRDGQAVALDEAGQARILDATEALAAQGMRVLGVAFRPLAEALARPEVEEGLIFLGIQGMIDPPRPEVADAVRVARQAGIRPIMITGDHPRTALAIAQALGISHNDRVLTGRELAALSDEALSAEVKEVSIFARVSPEHKLHIVQLLQAQGQVVAMTGDGVNDAPALKQAQIGVAMGITGTDVSKEASDMVLRDDNFATIVAAVEEGRVIYDNLRRFVRFAVAGNIGKVAVMVLWPLLFLLSGQPLTHAVALLPLQLLWLNLLTDGLLGLSMGFEQAERGVMRRPPHRPEDGIFSGGMGWTTAWTGLLIGALALAVGFAYHAAGLPQWQTMLFSALASLQLFQALATRSNEHALWEIGPFSNRPLWLAIGAVLLLQAVALYTPLGQRFLGVQALGGWDLLLCAGLGLLLYALIEASKKVPGRQTRAPLTQPAARSR